MTTIDKNSSIKPYSPVCTLCKHFKHDSWPVGEYPACQAFEQIPMAIWNGDNDHTQPVSGDKGIRFEKVTIE